MNLYQNNIEICHTGQRGRHDLNNRTFWYDCLSDGTQSDCKSENIFLGQWIRNLNQEDKIKSITETIGYMPERMWIIFSHTFNNEDKLILDLMLIDYQVIDKFVQTGSSVYLLEQSE